MRPENECWRFLYFVFRRTNVTAVSEQIGLLSVRGGKIHEVNLARVCGCICVEFRIVFFLINLHTDTTSVSGRPARSDADADDTSSVQVQSVPFRMRRISNCVTRNISIFPLTSLAFCFNQITRNPLRHRRPVDARTPLDLRADQRGPAQSANAPAHGNPLTCRKIYNAFFAIFATLSAASSTSGSSRRWKKYAHTHAPNVRPPPHSTPSLCAHARLENHNKNCVRARAHACTDQQQLISVHRHRRTTTRPER